MRHSFRVLRGGVALLCLGKDEAAQLPSDVPVARLLGAGVGVAAVAANLRDDAGAATSGVAGLAAIATDKVQGGGMKDARRTSMSPRHRLDRP
jgi:hypothetical protein